MSIQIRAYEDWTLSRICISAYAFGSPDKGAAVHLDLTPDQAERLAAQLTESVKRYRDLDAAAEKDLAPKKKKVQ